jgi:predicted O-methyltransferase YrrM
MKNHANPVNSSKIVLASGKYKMISENLVKELNQIAGSTMEGNVCYLHEKVPENNQFFEGFENKRKNIVAIAEKYNNITEIGFNAGHSAALMLSANPNLNLTSIDIGDHSYTIPCANMASATFTKPAMFAPFT